MLSFRFATPGDAVVLAALNQALIRDEASDNPMSLPELERRMLEWLSSAEYRAVMFSVGTETVAYAVYRDDGEGVYVRQFFVAAEHRRRGIGRATFRLLREEVLPPQTRIRLEVLTTNLRAAEFWRAIGFVEYARTLELR